MVKVSELGRKVTSVPVSPPLSPITFKRRIGNAMGEAHLVDLALALDLELQLDRKRVDDRNADPVQTAGDLVGILVELAARMELRHDDFGGRNAFAGVDIRRDAAAVVGDRHRPIGIERDGDDVGMAGKRLVDRVVDDLVDHVVQAGTVVGIADIHARPLANGIEALQDLDGIGTIFGVCAGFGFRQYRSFGYRSFQNFRPSRRRSDCRANHPLDGASRI